MEKRILIFSVAYLPQAAGAELAVKNLTSRLVGIEFDLITCRAIPQDNPREKIGNVNVFRVGFGGRFGRYLYPVFAARLAAKLHRQKPYDLVWGIMAAYAGAACLLFLRRNPHVKFLLTLQEGDPISHIHGRVRGFRRAWQKIFKRADYIQAISRYLAAWAVKEGATCPVEVVPNGVDVGRIKYHESPVTGQDSAKVIITTSRLVKKNGIDILIRAGAELKTLIRDSLPSGDLYEKFVIRIVGSGPEEKKLKKLTHKLKVEDIIEFAGSVAPDKIPEYLAKADIFIRPSRSEGLGSSFLEAMAAGVPVIGTAAGGITDFLKDGETGLIAKPEPRDLAEKIKILAEDPLHAQKLARTARELVESNYTWEKAARAMQGIFNRLS